MFHLWRCIVWFVLLGGPGACGSHHCGSHHCDRTRWSRFSHAASFLCPTISSWIAVLAKLTFREKHSHCLEERVYLPTIVCGRVIWHLGYTTAKSVEAFFDSYNGFRQAAISCDPSYCAKGILTDGFCCTRKSLKQLFPQNRQLFPSCHHQVSSANPMGDQSGANNPNPSALPTLFCPICSKNNRSLGQRLRRFIEQVTRIDLFFRIGGLAKKYKIAGEENGQRVRGWIGRKKDGWYALFYDSDIPKTSALLDQAHNALARKLFMMKGFHHEQGSQRSFLNGLAILYNLIPYQRRAKNAGKCGIEVEGGKLPTDDWLLNLQILTSGGFQ